MNINWKAIIKGYLAYGIPATIFVFFGLWHIVFRLVAAAFGGYVTARNSDFIHSVYLGLFAGAVAIVINLLSGPVFSGGSSGDHVVQFVLNIILTLIAMSLGGVFRILLLRQTKG